MIPNVMETKQQKRKLDAEQSRNQLGHQGGWAVGQDSHGPIYYVPTSKRSRLDLIQGDGNSFSDITSLIGQYESAMDRRESLASNLGAKLIGPRLLRSVETFFDGPINLLQFRPFAEDLTWVDVVRYARSNPNDYTLVIKADGGRWCQFYVNRTPVEITEDDWRLAWSPALDRFPLDQLLQEDEAVELATLEILEQRTSMLYKKADEVAARARILNRKLYHRRQDIQRRGDSPPDTQSARSSATQVHDRTSNAQVSDVHEELLKQFMAASSRSTSGTEQTLGSTSPPQLPPHITVQAPPAPASARVHGRQGSALESVADSRTESYKLLIAQGIDRLRKGDEIQPPCDRCRRLKFSCIKHLTACVGCTKKHAKCSWSAVTDDEIQKLKEDIGLTTGHKSSADDNEEGITGHSDVIMAQDDHRMSIDEASGTTLAALKERSRSLASREGPQLATLEPPISRCIDEERYQLSPMGKGVMDWSA
ncbi:hypothetical protein BGZ63DRAFT_421079 [Mariannaea sp. PMI_226]|nr:hypothetical protein BGZ63DRAFT_421079 [Mariannaea sp. PMI_226]